MKNVLKMAIACFLMSNTFCMEIENKQDWNVLTPEGMHELLKKNFRHPRKIINEYLDYNCQNDLTYQDFKYGLVNEITGHLQSKKIYEKSVRDFCVDPINNSLIISIEKDKKYIFEKITLDTTISQELLSLERCPDSFTLAPKTQLLCYSQNKNMFEKTDNVFLFDVVNKKIKKSKSLDHQGTVHSICHNEDESIFFFLIHFFVCLWDTKSDELFKYKFDMDHPTRIFYESSNDSVILEGKDGDSQIFHQEEIRSLSKHSITLPEKLYLVNENGELIKIKPEISSILKTENYVKYVNYDRKHDRFFTLEENVQDFSRLICIWDGKTDKKLCSLSIPTARYMAFDDEHNRLFAGGIEGIWYIDLAIPKLEKPNLSLQQYYALLGIAKNKIAENPLGIFEDKKLDEIFKDYPEIIDAIRMCARQKGKK